ncbi:hypothetical protein V3481_015256 [Fusarium oxysporum f. sp. vasinfectum]
MERAESIPNLTTLGREAEVDLVPGTEIMTEIGGARFYHDSDNPDSVVLIPQPTDDPHDPLNWSMFWKTLVIVNQGIFVIASVKSRDREPATPGTGHPAFGLNNITFINSITQKVDIIP